MVGNPTSACPRESRQRDLSGRTTILSLILSRSATTDPYQCIEHWLTTTDYLHLTKSLGHVALSQLPLQALMSPVSYISSRPTSSSLVSILTTIPQSALTPYHRLFGRVILAPLLLSHANLYLSFFAQSPHPDYPSLIAKRIQDPDVQWGLGAISLAVSIILYARPLGRRQSSKRGSTGSIRSERRVFYVVHLLLVAGLCAAAYFHVVHARVYVFQTLAAFLVNLGCWLLLGESR